MEESEVVSVVKNFMHHAAFNLINAAESNNPELMWAVMQNLESMVGSYIEAISEEVNVGQGQPEPNTICKKGITNDLKNRPES